MEQTFHRPLPLLFHCPQNSHQLNLKKISAIPPPHFSKSQFSCSHSTLLLLQGGGGCKLRLQKMRCKNNGNKYQ